MIETIFAATQSLSSVLYRLNGEPRRSQRRRFTFRFRDDLTFDTRLEYRGVAYRITEIDEDDERQRFSIVIGEAVSS